MISNEEIESLFKAQDGVAYVQVNGDGYHYELTLVSDKFSGQSRVSRQQWVYALLKDQITSGSLHALTIKTYTRDEWETLQHG